MSKSVISYQTTYEITSVNLLQEDIQSLKPKELLTDIVVNSYLTLLQSEKCLVLYHHFINTLNPESIFFQSIEPRQDRRNFPYESGKLRTSEIIIIPVLRNLPFGLITLRP